MTQKKISSYKRSSSVGEKILVSQNKKVDKSAIGNKSGSGTSNIFNYTKNSFGLDANESRGSANFEKSNSDSQLDNFLIIPFFINETLIRGDLLRIEEYMQEQYKGNLI